MITDSRQHHADDPALPRDPAAAGLRRVGEARPGRTSRATPGARVPNYNGYQPDAEGNLVFNPDSYVVGRRAVPHLPGGLPVGPPRGLHVRPAVGRADPVDHQPERRRRLVEPLVQPQHEPRLLPVRHEPGGALQRRAGATACGPSGSTRPAASSRYDASTGEVAWRNHLGTDMSHGQGPLTTASDLLFVGQIDGRVLAMDAADRRRALGVPDRLRHRGGAGHLRDRRRAVRRRVRRGVDQPVRRIGHAGRLAVGVQARRHLHDRVGKPGGAGHGAAVDPSPGGRRRRRGRDGRQHRALARTSRDRRHRSRARQRRRRTACSRRTCGCRSARR